MNLQWQKMLAGELYDPADPHLVLARRRARDLSARLNRSADEEHALRRTIYQELFGSVGSGLMIEPPFHCDYGVNIHLGDRVFFNFNCVILDPAEVRIGDEVLLGPHVQIYTATHPMRREIRRTGWETAHPVSIGAGVWIGGGAILCPGVSIGEGTVIGAGSVVTRSMPVNVFAAGNPCRVLRRLDGEDGVGDENG